MYTPETDLKERERESIAFCHLEKTEEVLPGDVYGGRDWGFVFIVGSKEASYIRGRLAGSDIWCYRPRTPKMLKGISFRLKMWRAWEKLQLYIKGRS